MMDIKTRILEVLKRGYLMSLGTADKSGAWVADIIYVYDEGLNIYWMSDPEVRHSGAIHEGGQAAGTITVSDGVERPELGIQFSGKAEKIEGNRHDLALKLWAKRSKPQPEETADVLEGDSWYMLRPTKFDLIDQENYGWDKKSLEL